MNTINNDKKRSSKFRFILPITIMLIPLLITLFSFVFAQDEQSKEVFLQMPDEQYKECVRSTEFMRHNHWELLRAVREDVVRYGVRGEVSLKNCKSCHTSREQFCDKCHNAVSLKPDCFGCHYYP